MDKGCKNAHPKLPDFKKFLIPLYLFELGSEKNGGNLKRKLKVPSLVWNGKRFLGGVFEKFLKKQKSPLNSSNREEKVIEILLNCKVSYRNRSVTNQLPKNENILILGNEWDIINLRGDFVWSWLKENNT